MSSTLLIGRKRDCSVGLDPIEETIVGTCIKPLEENEGMEGERMVWGN